MPGYTIKGFKFALDDEPYVADKVREHYKTYDWNDGDALHCRTRAIWNPEMLFISINKINSKVGLNQSNKVYVTIIDYSKKGLVKDKSELFWRISGDTKWKTITLSPTENENHLFGLVIYS